MLSPDDNPGIFYFLVGMVVLVLTAVGMSLMLEKRVKLSSGVGQVKQDIATSEAELSELRATCERRSASLAEIQARHHPSSENRQQILSRIAEFKQRKLDLRLAKERLATGIAALEKEFSDYRANYRRRTWTKAVGEKFARIAIRGGREYRQVTITKVTDVGLEIRHENGIARIQAPDLDPEWQERFQWSDEDRRARLQEEYENRVGKPAVVAVEPEDSSDDVDPPAVVVPQVTRQTNPGAAEDTANLNALRVLVSGWKSKVSRLSSELSVAASNGGSQRSVPGSLETWQGRASRLGKELTRARIELSKAKARLAAVSPNDPLLRVRPGFDE